MTLSFTVVVPTYNRPRPLDDCLAALVALDHPRDRFEIVIVDDGSAVPVDDLVRRHADRSGVSVRLIRQSNAGPASARNTGAAVARHDFIAFTDDDCRPRADWLTALARELALDPQCAVGGPPSTPSTTTAAPRRANS
jgi:glycosyltransferase involved in cell wall biosynthesis